MDRFIRLSTTFIIDLNEISSISLSNKTITLLKKSGGTEQAVHESTEEAEENFEATWKLISHENYKR